MIKVKMKVKVKVNVSVRVGCPMRRSLLSRAGLRGGEALLHGDAV